MVNRVACFLTCGYTEAGAMQYFLKKINGNYEYKQYLPNKTIKKKGDSKSISSEISGLTGDALLEKIYNILGKYRDEISKCKAVLIEDDLDGKFHGCSKEEIEKYNAGIICKVHEKLQKEIPVYLLYASPEVESWFVADWENGFEYLYCKDGVVNDVEHNAKLFYTHHLRQFIDKNVLGEYVDDIEEYGWFDGHYVKLSDRLIEAIQMEIKEFITELKNSSPLYVQQIVQSRDIYYSKKLHGDVMLRNIEPRIVADRCRKYFGSTYNQMLGAE